MKGNIFRYFNEGRTGPQVEKFLCLYQTQPTRNPSAHIMMETCPDTIHLKPCAQ